MLVYDVQWLTVHIRHADFVEYKGYPEIHDKNVWEGKGNHRCDGGNTVVSNILPILLIFALKETSGRPEISRKRSGEKQSHYVAAWAFGGVQQHRNTKNRTQAKLMPWKRWWLCRKILEGVCWESYNSILLIHIFKKCYCDCIFTFWTFYVRLYCRIWNF